MESVLRAAVVYLLIWLVMRVAGKRSFAEITAFEFVLLLIISETTQNALTDDDRSITNSALLVLTLVGIDVFLSLLKQKSPAAETILDSRPLVLLDKGTLFEERLKKERVDRAEIMQAARQSHGLERLDQIKYAVLECNGQISIVPQE
jgi:uncharacterized membrane protein YcaP (DUF421 family)